MDTKKAMAEELAEMLADAHATGFAEAIEMAAKVADTGGADYPGDYRISAAIRAITPTKDGQK